MPALIDYSDPYFVRPGSGRAQKGQSVMQWIDQDNPDFINVVHRFHRLAADKWGQIDSMIEFFREKQDQSPLVMHVKNDQINPDHITDMSHWPIEDMDLESGITGVIYILDHDLDYAFSIRRDQNSL
jgi:hypothetical protein